MTDELPKDVYKGLPRLVMVGHYRFRIVVSNAEKHPGQLGDADGYTDTARLRMYLSDTLSMARAIDVVQHELTHAINWVGNITDESNEEEFTTVHSTGLVSLWIINPKVFAWFSRTLRLLRKDGSKDDDE